MNGIKLLLASLWGAALASAWWSAGAFGLDSTLGLVGALLGALGAIATLTAAWAWLAGEWQ